MEIAQLRKIAYIIISYSNPYIFVTKERCLKYERRTHFGRAKVKGHTMMHTYTPNQCHYHGSTFYTLWNNPGKSLRLMVTMTRSKVKSRTPPN